MGQGEVKERFYSDTVVILCSHTTWQTRKAVEYMSGLLYNEQLSRWKEDSISGMTFKLSLAHSCSFSLTSTAGEGGDPC